MKIDEQIKSELNTLSESEKKKVLNFIHRILRKHAVQPPSVLQKLLLNAPIWGEEEEDRITTLREEIDKWVIKKY